MGEASHRISNAFCPSSGRRGASACSHRRVPCLPVPAPSTGSLLVLPWLVCTGPIMSALGTPLAGGSGVAARRAPCMHGRHR